MHQTHAAASTTTPMPPASRFYGTDAIRPGMALEAHPVVLPSGPSGEGGLDAYARGSAPRGSQDLGGSGDRAPVPAGTGPDGRWTVHNFEVEEHHTYVAGGIRVHNTSGEFKIGADGKRSISVEKAAPKM